MLLLDLFYYVIILELFLSLGHLSESILPDSKARLLDDQIWVFLLLLDDPGGDVVVDHVVGPHSRSLLLVVDYLPLDL